MIGLFIFTISAAAFITLGLLIVGVILNLLTPLLGLFGVFIGILKSAYSETHKKKFPLSIRRPIRMDIH